MLGGGKRRQEREAQRRDLLQSLRSDQVWNNTIILEDRGESWRLRRQEMDRQQEENKNKERRRVLIIKWKLSTHHNAE